MRFRTRFLKPFLKGENRVESPVLVLVDSPDSDKDVGYESKPRQRLSSSSQSGSDVDRQ
jgi:hypothetical protein